MYGQTKTYPSNFVFGLIAFDQINSLVRYVYDMRQGEAKYTKI